MAERPLPEPARNEVRVRVRATAINRADLLQRMGAYPAPADSPPDVPGLELAGEVDALGPGVERSGSLVLSQQLGNPGLAKQLADPELGRQVLLHAESESPVERDVDSPTTAFPPRLERRDTAFHDPSARG